MEYLNVIAENFFFIFDKLIKVKNNRSLTNKIDLLKINVKNDYIEYSNIIKIWSCDLSEINRLLFAEQLLQIYNNQHRYYFDLCSLGIIKN